MPLELAKLTSPELLALDPAHTVFFFPVGSLENHGPHLPLGLDLFEAEAQSRLTAQKVEAEMPGWKAVLMPSAPLGIDTDCGAQAIQVRAHVLRDWLVDSCRSLGKLGFRHFICVSGQLGPRQLTAIEEAGKSVTNPFALLFKLHRRRLISLSSAFTSKDIVKQSPLWSDPLEHGGRRDTSVALAIARPLVKEHYQALPKNLRTGSFFERAYKKYRGTLPGYWGNPAEATEEEGLKILNKNAELVFPDIKTILEGKTEINKFRSWYSILPPNKSFFKSWLLFTLIFTLFIFWLFYVSVFLSSI